MDRLWTFIGLVLLYWFLYDAAKKEYPKWAVLIGRKLELAGKALQDDGFSRMKDITS